jgi:hypothetical protein
MTQCNQTDKKEKRKMAEKLGSVRFLLTNPRKPRGQMLVIFERRTNFNDVGCGELDGTDGWETTGTNSFVDIFFIFGNSV